MRFNCILYDKTPLFRLRWSQSIFNIKSDFLFVVCPSRTIFGKRKGAHVHLEGWKHGYGEVGLNMVCTQ